MNWTDAMILSLLMASILVGTPGTWAAESKGKLTHTVRLDAKALYAGFEASKVVLDADEGAVKLDPLALKYGGSKFGTIITDPIDLLPVDKASPHLRAAGSIKTVDIDIDVNIPTGSHVYPHVSINRNFFTWPRCPDNWAEVPDRVSAPHLVAMFLSPGRNVLDGRVNNPKGRYLRLRLELTGKDSQHLPTVKSVTIASIFEPAPPWKGKVRIVKFENREIVTSPIDFGYEAPDQSDIAKFHKRYHIDRLVAGANTDFERAWRLTKWVGRVPILRERFDVPYNPWDINRIVVETASGPRIKPHCLGYAITLVTALTSIDIPARHWCIRGFRDCSHEVVEAWCQELGKWVFLDPSLSTYYYDLRTKVPLSILEMHSLWLNTFLKPGEDLNHPGHMSEELKRRVKARDHSKIVGHISEGKPYGGEKREWSSWHWGHGYLSTGWLQLTPRNNFHSQPKPIFKRFGHDPHGWSGFPYWVDAKTPIVGRSVTNWVRRRRDVYWTLHQASMHLTRSEKEGTLAVEFGQSQPFFKEFVVTVDGKVVPEVGRRYQWKLKKGVNTLKVIAIDRYGRKSVPGFVQLEYIP